MTGFFRVSNEVGVSPGQECGNHLVGGLEHLDYFSIQLGMSSCQLTNSYFSEG
jgi:hypothetical protein